MTIPPPTAAPPTSYCLCHHQAPSTRLTRVHRRTEPAARTTCPTCLELHRDRWLSRVAALEHAASQGCWKSDGCEITKELLPVYRNALRGRVAIGDRCAEQAAAP